MIILGLPRSGHRNPKYWAKPNEFYPEHFLDADGKLRQKIEGYFPFSTGMILPIPVRIVTLTILPFKQGNGLVLVNN